MNGFSLRPDPYRLARYWTLFVVLFLGLVLFLQEASYFELDAFGVWILSCIGVLYLSRKDVDDLTGAERPWALVAGVAICLLSFLSIPLGFTNPPFSIGEFSILLSGIGILVFAFYRYRTLILPVSLPFIAVAGFSGYELFLRHEEWVSGPLVPVTTGISVGILNLIGIPTFVRENVFTFFSRSGQPISLSIVSDCTGIMSLGTFTIALLIVFFSFSRSFSRKSLLWILAGYIGTYCANILRIVVIALSGYFFGPAGVIEHVHVNIGWIIFSLWMILFWYLFFTRHLGISLGRSSMDTGDKTGKE